MWDVFRVRKLFTVLFLALSFPLFLTACASNDPPAPSPSPEVREWAVPVRGEWVDDIFRNPSIGLQFTLPDGWLAATDEEIAIMMGLSADSLDLSGNVWDMIDLVAVTDMMAMHPRSGIGVHIILERLIFPSTGMSEAMYLERFTRQQSEIFGATIHLDVPSPVRIGNYYWYSYGREADDSSLNARGFISIQNGFARMISIVYGDDLAVLEEVLSMFEEL